MLQTASLMSLFLEPLNKVLLNYFSGPQIVTTYDFSMKIIWGIQSLFGAAMRVFLQLAGQTGPAIGRAYSRAIALVGVPVLASHIVSAIFLSWLAHHWMVVDSKPLMIFFVFATLSNLGMIYIMPLYVSLIGRGDMGFILRSQAILASTNVAVSLALVPIFGLLGAAFGLLCATAYNVAAIYRRYSRTSGAPEGIDAALAGISKRYALTIVLFAAAIVLGLQDPVDPLLQVGVLGVLGAIMAREPLVRMLAERVWRRR
jgi:O-antigen/teichoic acid export membrane protein